MSYGHKLQLVLTATTVLGLLYAQEEQIDGIMIAFN